MTVQSTQPLLLVISGPSGSGKGTAIDHLSATSGIRRIATFTTRRPRRGEQDGIDYEFVSGAQFLGLVKSGRIWEVAQTYGTYHYGSPSEILETEIEVPLLIELEPNGFLRARTRSARRVVGIFVLPPSPEHLAGRLESRGRSEDHSKRLDAVAHQMTYAWAYDYCVVNDDPYMFLELVSKIVEIEIAKTAGAQALVRLSQLPSQLKDRGPQ